MRDHFTPSEYTKLLDMKSIGLKRDDKEPICQRYDLKYKHIANQSSSYLAQELNLVKHFLCAFMPGTVRMDCGHGIKRSTLFSVFPLRK